MLAVLSWLPAGVQVRTPAPGTVEHMIAYAGTALFLSVGYPDWRKVGIGIALVL
jgi:hypothetical protein